MDHSNETDCAGCPIAHAMVRRAFLRDAVTGAFIAIGSLGLLAQRASAMPLAFARGLGSGADKAYAIPATDGVVIDKDESVIIARADKKLFAFSLACPHQNTAIRWEGPDHRFQCPKHHSRYRADGTFIEGRATRGLDRFAVTRDGNNLIVNLDALYREDENAAQWTAAFVALT
jgi:Rieske Fe-S protein